MKTGQHYATGSSTALLDARTKEDDFGTSRYLFLVRAKYVSHQGEKPMPIMWKLEHAMPIEFYNLAVVGRRLVGVSLGASPPIVRRRR